MAMPRTKRTDFCGRLITVMEQNDLSVISFSQLLNLDPSNVYRWLHGEGHPRVDTLIAMARRLNVDLNWLLLGDEAYRTVRDTTYDTTRYGTDGTDRTDRTGGIEQ